MRQFRYHSIFLLFEITVYTDSDKAYDEARRRILSKLCEWEANDSLFYIWQKANIVPMNLRLAGVDTEVKGVSICEAS
jgi:hypothetical protein